MIKASKYLIVISFFFFFSCSGIFDARDPEEPSGSSIISSARTVSELIGNFEKSLKELNTNFYESVFADSIKDGYEYVFETEATDIDNPLFFSDWERNDEKAFLEYFVEAGGRFEIVEILDVDLNEPSVSDYELNLTYNLLLNDGSSVEGKSIFSLVKNNNNLWYIRKWLDKGGNSGQQISFSKLKEKYKQ